MTSGLSRGVSFPACTTGHITRGSLSTGSLSRVGVSVQGVSVQGWGLCPGLGSLSRVGVSVQGWGLCPGLGSLSRVGVSVQGVSVQGWVSVQGGLCPGGLYHGLGSLFGNEQVVRGGSLSRCRGFCLRGSLSRRVSVEGLCPGGLCPGWSLSRGSLSGGLCPGVSVWGSLSRGSLSRGSLFRGGLCLITSWRYASYWNAFLVILKQINW